MPILLVIARGTLSVLDGIKALKVEDASPDPFQERTGTSSAKKAKNLPRWFYGGKKCSNVAPAHPLAGRAVA